LPDISELNGNPLANMSEFDGIPFYAGVPVPAAAYSVRLLGSAVGISSYTGPAMRVRRDTNLTTGDDDEADIAFDSGVISLDSAISNASVGVTATTLGQFLNVGTVGGTTYTNPDSLTVTASCFVDEWKDQSGNANHATEAIFGNQAKIHSGTVNTDLITDNGNPAVFAQLIEGLRLPSVIDVVSAFYVARRTSSLCYNALFLTDSTGGTNNSYFTMPGYNINGGQIRMYDGTTNVATTIYNSVDQYLVSAIATSSATIHVDGVSEATGSMTAVGVEHILRAGAGSNSVKFEGNAQEIILYTSDQSANRTSIESDINGFFSVYP
jgi:hypothetical protein